MISENLTYAVDLAADTVRQTIKQPLVRFDNKAHTVVCVVNNNGTGANLTGCTAMLYVVRSDNSTVPCNAVITSNTITAEMLPAVYNLAGSVNFYLRLTSGSYKRTILWLSGNVVAGDTQTFVDGTVTIPSIEEFNELRNTCQTYANTATAAVQTIQSYPYSQVAANAASAAQSASAAAQSAEDARTATGVPTGGSVGDILMKAASGAEWSDPLTDMWTAINGAGNDFVAGTATYDDQTSVARYYTSEERSFTFTVDDYNSKSPKAVIVTGVSPSGTNGIAVHSIHASLSGNTATVYYKATNSYSANTKPNTLTAYYFAIY